MGLFRRKPSQKKYVEAAIKVATNLYLNTTQVKEGQPPAVHDLLLRGDFPHFRRQDSRYRYLIFCFSGAITAALVYDEKKLVQPEALIQGCFNFAMQYATEYRQEFFDELTDSQDSIGRTMDYFAELGKYWSRWAEFEKENNSDETNNVICCMIHTAESDEPITDTDLRRLGELALQIDCWIPTMHGAFMELANR
jgi:hypothetical protein